MLLFGLYITACKRQINKNSTSKMRQSLVSMISGGGGVGGGMPKDRIRGGVNK